MEQVQQEPKKLEVGCSLNEQKFTAALKSKKIIQSTPNDILQVLGKLVIKVGVRASNLPDDVERSVLIEHIAKNFGGNTLAEIELAFDMAMSGKLPVKATCYENFSCAYFSEIMVSYRAWAVEEYKYVSNKRQEETLLLGNKVDFPDEEMMEWIEEWKHKIDTVSNPMMIPQPFYDFLDKKGLLNLTKNQKFEYMSNDAVDLLHGYLVDKVSFEGTKGDAMKSLDSFNRMKDKGHFTGNEYDSLKEIAKKVAVFYHLKNKNYEM